MSASHGFIIVLLIILIYVVVVKYPQQSFTTPRIFVRAPHKQNFSLSGSRVKASKNKSIENSAMKENMEYFANGTTGSDAGTMPSVECPVACDDAQDPSKLTNYHDWILSQAVDQSVVANHAEYVKDRLDNGIVSGSTTGEQAQEMEGSDMIPWQGLRRPQRVPVNNPLQVPEYNDNTYTDGPTFTWNSSGTETWQKTVSTSE